MAWIRKRMTRTDGPRFDVEYRAPDGSRRRQTFSRSKDALTFKRAIEAELAAGAWMDPNLGNQTFGTYATNWLRTRAWLGAKTKETYECQLRRHILPVLGEVPLNRLTPVRIRAWHAGLFEKAEMSDDGRPGPNTIAKCYRLVHAILETAMDDEILRRNPCRIRRAGREEHAERPTASISEVFALAEVVKAERRTLVLLAAFSGLRLSELLALRRRHVDVLHRRLVVTEATIELAHGELVTKQPKSKAGMRRVHLDAVVFELVEQHLENFTAASPDAYLFTGDKGGQLRRAVWYQEWSKARAVLGLKYLRFHDLRHTHGTLVAQVGATTRETMRRLGHSTMQAAMIYQHGSDERDRVIAQAMGERITQELKDAVEVRKLGGES